MLLFFRIAAHLSSVTISHGNYTFIGQVRLSGGDFCAARVADTRSGDGPRLSHELERSVFIIYVPSRVIIAHKGRGYSGISASL